MKLMKRIAAIMLSVVMVLGMSSVVSASSTTTPSGSSPATRGKITITNAIPGQTYTIYKILELESYSHGGTPESGNYAYKVATGSRWDDFITGAGNAYLEKDTTSGYVTWKAGVTADDATKAAFAKKALEYAKTTSGIANAGTYTVPAATATPTTVVFDDLDLGYYLVDSSAGALCSLDTTNNVITIEEKNGVPSVEKKVQEDSKVGTADEYGDTNTADIGQTVNFKTTITAQPGAENYVLHDKMSAGLTFDSSTVVVKKSTSGTESILASGTHYTITPATGITDGCTFEIKFEQTFCDTLAADDKIIVTYSATLNENAAIGTTGNTNETHLSYGNDSKTTESTTTTYTYSIPVFKYTNKPVADTPLAGAKFVLSKDATGASATPIELVSTTAPTGETGDFYRVAKSGEAGAVTEITTPATGKFTIQGLDADTYYLHETKQPDGYNKLKDPVTVVITEDGKITVSGVEETTVKVLNNTGSILPSTGGRGTTILYVLGALLVLGSSVVLITKRRMKE